MKGARFASVVLLFLASAPLHAVTVLRQPYLQMGTPTSMTLVWRTDLPSDSRVRYGKIQGMLDHSAEVPLSVTHHVVTLSGLSPATRYYYEVGSTTEAHAGGSAEHYFETSPAPGAAAPFRVWVVGDSGTGDLAQAQVRDAMLSVTAGHRPDLFLHMGDIAYTAGTELEFTANHFTPYQDILRHTVLWTTLGNHEGMSTVSGDPGPSGGPYYDAFVLPAAGEAGGEPSGTEAYYSFDYAHVHFISLNSYQVDRSANGAMATWLKADLQATRQAWIVAFWHHPPYTHGTHNSDFEIEHIEMRENLLPILEAGGVDLVLGGHSHGYERSFLIDAAYGTPTPDRQTLLEQGHVLDLGDGRSAGDGAYTKNPGVNPHQGTLYVVAGHGGAATGGALDHPVMYYSEAQNGSLLLDVDADRIVLSNVRSTGFVSDTCTIVKREATAPVVVATDPPRGATLESLTTIEVTFSTAVTNVDASDLTVAGVPAASVLIEAPDRYRFTLSPAPAPGTLDVVLPAGGIVHATTPALVFGGDSFTYTLQCPVPADVSGLGFVDRTTLVWNDTAGLYDVARGGELPVGVATPTCLATDLATAAFADAAIPGPGEAWWYLVRGSSACHPGTWGHEGEHGVAAAERSVPACP